jgi:hypothetical protein
MIHALKAFVIKGFILLTIILNAFVPVTFFLMILVLIIIVLIALCVCVYLL